VSKIDPYLLHLVHQGNLGPPPEPPRYDWRAFTAEAKTILEEVGRDIRMFSARGDRFRKGEDLGQDEQRRAILVESLARLLATAFEHYENAKLYIEIADQPRKRLRPSVAKKLTPEKQTAREYDKMLADFPKRTKGNPTKTREADPFELGPLVSVYWPARDWWMKHTGGKFTPAFAGGDDVSVGGEHYDDADDTAEIHHGSDYNNADARFLLGVLQVVEPKCRARHASQLEDRLRGSSERRSRRKKKRAPICQIKTRKQDLSDLDP
jgi:hypothetical protein